MAIRPTTYLAEGREKSDRSVLLPKQARLSGDEAPEKRPGKTEVQAKEIAKLHNLAPNPSFHLIDTSISRLSRLFWTSSKHPPFS